MSDKIQKQFDLEIKSTDKDKREVTVIGSVQQEDRDRDIVDIKTMNVKNYKQNPVVLWSHQSRDLPIAKAINVTKAAGNTQLKFKLQFAKEEDYPFADQVYKLIKAGFINASSIGFAVNYEKSEYDKDRGGYNFNNAELLEISLVNVPANQGALITQRQFKDYCDDDSNFDKFKDNFIIDDYDVENTNDISEEPEQNINDLIERMNAVELSIQELKTKNVEVKSSSYIDDLFSTIVDGSDLKSNDTSKSKGTIDDSDLDELINIIKTNKE